MGGTLFQTRQGEKVKSLSKEKKEKKQKKKTGHNKKSKTNIINKVGEREGGRRHGIKDRNRFKSANLLFHFHEEDGGRNMRRLTGVFGLEGVG